MKGGGHRPHFVEEQAKELNPMIVDFFIMSDVASKTEVRREMKVEGQKIAIIPYLPFNGNCEEALNTYLKAFGGEICYMSRWSASAYDVGVGQRNKILHAEFTLGNVRMAAGDSVDYIETAADIRLMVHLDSKEEALRAIALLEEGGTILSPLHHHLTPDEDGCEAIVTDRFGVTWIVTCPKDR